VRIVVSENGPYLVSGSVPLVTMAIETNDEGESWEWAEGDRLEGGEAYALCRCGQSGSKPFCDGSHRRVGFDGTETADRAPYLEQAGMIRGPAFVLTDAEALCAFARFCDAQGTVWALAERRDRAAVDLAEREARLCPSGRLVTWRAKTGGELEPSEPDLEPSIALVEDPHQGVSGPIWVRGGIAIESFDGASYEVRNRTTICRCGASRNKPFCDGTHAAVGFRSDR
jgi:CDGSH-type Zn-finger protein